MVDWLVVGFLVASAPIAARAPAPAPAPEIRRLDVFGNAGAEVLLRSPLALARDDKQGDLIVSNFESGEVVILDKSGALVTRLGPHEGLVTPYGVAVDPLGRIIVGELRTGLVKVFSSGGLLVDQIDLPQGMGRDVSPGRLMLGHDRLYVADLSANKILIWTTQGAFVQSVGSFEYLQKAAVLNSGEILGLSAHGKAVQIFDASGEVLRSFGDHGDTSDKNMSFPTGFAVDAKQRLWLADPFQHRLKVFSLSGEFLFSFGHLEKTVGGDGFFFPVDLCFGERGELFVLEKGAERIQVFQVADLQGPGSSE